MRLPSAPSDAPGIGPRTITAYPRPIATEDRHMTYFLPDAPADLPLPDGFVSREPTGVFDGIGAATSQLMRHTTANWMRQTQITAEQTGIAELAYERMGQPDIPGTLGSKGFRLPVKTEVVRLKILGMARKQPPRILTPGGKSTCPTRALRRASRKSAFPRTKLKPNC